MRILATACFVFAILGFAAAKVIDLDPSLRTDHFTVSIIFFFWGILAVCCHLSGYKGGIITVIAAVTLGVAILSIVKQLETILMTNSSEEVISSFIEESIILLVALVLFALGHKRHNERKLRVVKPGNSTYLNRRKRR